MGLRVFLQSSGEELGRVVDLFDGTGEPSCRATEASGRAEAGGWTGTGD